MGRKAARTVEYFPHFVKFGKTLFLLEEKWGPDGFSFWFKLLMILGAATDHFLDCSKETRPGRENWEYLVARMRFPGQKCEEITAWLAERGNLDGQLWTDHRIIWCQDFVNNLTDVYSGRTGALPSRPFPAISGPETPSTADNFAGNGLHEGISGKSIPIGREGLKEGREEISPLSAMPSDQERLSIKVDDPKENPMIPELLQIHKKATAVDLMIGREEMADLLAIFRKYDGPTVVAAYQVCQTEKPGKPFRFFLDDFAMYYAKVRVKVKADENKCPGCGIDQTRNPHMHTPGCPRRGPPPAESAVVSPVPPATLVAPAPAPVDNFEDDLPWPAGKPGELALKAQAAPPAIKEEDPFEPF